YELWDPFPTHFWPRLWTLTRTPWSDTFGSFGGKPESKPSLSSDRAFHPDRMPGAERGAWPGRAAAAPDGFARFRPGVPGAERGARLPRTGGSRQAGPLATGSRPKLAGSVGYNLIGPADCNSSRLVAGMVCDSTRQNF